jgi:hypothetical protein
MPKHKLSQLENKYSEEQVAYIFLAAMYSTSKPHYTLIINIFSEKRNNGETALFLRIGTRFLKTDEKTLRRKH